LYTSTDRNLKARILGDIRVNGRRAPLIAMLGALSYRSNLRLNCRAYAKFKCQQGYRFTGTIDGAGSIEQSVPRVVRQK
jgi:hypothetical protein